MTACVVLAAETAAIFGYLVYVAPLMPDCAPQTAVLCILVLISYSPPLQVLISAHITPVVSTWTAKPQSIPEALLGGLVHGKW